MTKPLFKEIPGGTIISTVTNEVVVTVNVAALMRRDANRITDAILRALEDEYGERG